MNFGGMFYLEKTLGILGGMGPLATVKLFEKIVLLTKAHSDQEHLHILIDNNTSIPDRTDYILGIGEDPRPYLIDSAKRLKIMGADFLIMPCNTAHHFYKDIKKEVDIIFLSMIEETAKTIVNEYDGVKNIGLLATQGTYNANVYDDVFENYGLNILKPSVDKQKYVMELIYNVKKGIVHKDFSNFNSVLEEFKGKKVDVFIMGCTELSVALDLYDLKGGYIDPLEIIAKRAIEFGGGEVVD